APHGRPGGPAQPGPAGSPPVECRSPGSELTNPSSREGHVGYRLPPGPFAGHPRCCSHPRSPVGRAHRQVTTVQTNCDRKITIAPKVLATGSTATAVGPAPVGDKGYQADLALGWAGGDPP